MRIVMLSCGNITGDSMSIPQKPKPWRQRVRDLFERDLPFGHKVEQDKTKVIDRKRKYKPKDIDE